MFNKTTWVISALVLCAALCIAAYLFTGIQGNWEFALTRRGTNVIAMIFVAFAVSTSTVLFHTVTNNRILTPSIMGFDALYVSLQTGFAFALGASVWASTDAPLKFLIEVSAMVGFSVLLYRWLFRGTSTSLHLLLLIGIVFGALFRGIASLLQRLMDPNEYLILQGLFFATFNKVNSDLLLVSGVLIGVIGLLVFYFRHQLDVAALGREHAINLGVDHQRLTTLVLIACATLVSVSTALVGPITFFGLLVASVAYLLAPKYSHLTVIGIATLLGIISLVGGQFVLERLFSFNTALSVIIELVGGIVFICLLLATAGEMTRTQKKSRLIPKKLTVSQRTP